MDFNNKDNNKNTENKNFYQKIATNSQNDGSHVTCGYFETLQHKAGIQSNRKNGYYVKPIEKNDLIDDNLQENTYIEKQDVKEHEQGIDDIFTFDKETIALNQEDFSNENFVDLNDNDFYNDFFASDEEIDNEEENKQIYQQDLKEIQKQISFDKTSAYASNIKETIVNNLNQPIGSNGSTSTNTIDRSDNKKMIIIASIIGCIVVILICSIILGNIWGDKENKNTQIATNSNSNNSSVISNTNKDIPKNTTEIIVKENSILCFSLTNINIYKNEDLSSVVGTLDKYSLISIQKDFITSKSCKYNDLYLETDKLYYYNGTIEEFNDETIKFFEDYAKNHNTLNIEFESLIQSNEENQNDILIELGTSGNDTVKTDQYIINFDTSNENFSLLGDLSDKINENAVDTGEIYPQQKTIELYNGQKYGNLIINSVNINGDLYYGASQKNIDLYDTCSSESFGVPGGGRPILIGGHNTNSLKSLHNVKIGDIVTISTSYGTFEYEVFYVGIGKIITENALANDYLKDIETNEEIFTINGDEEILGIYTCYQNPNDDISPTPYRFAIKAKKVASRTETTFQ